MGANNHPTVVPGNGSAPVPDGYDMDDPHDRYMARLTRALALGTYLRIRGVHA